MNPLKPPVYEPGRVTIIHYIPAAQTYFSVEISATTKKAYTVGLLKYMYYPKDTKTKVCIKSHAQLRQDTYVP